MRHFAHGVPSSGGPSNLDWLTSELTGTIGQTTSHLRNHAVAEYSFWGSIKLLLHIRPYNFRDVRPTTSLKELGSIVVTGVKQCDTNARR